MVRLNSRTAQAYVERLQHSSALARRCAGQGIVPIVSCRKMRRNLTDQPELNGNSGADPVSCPGLFKCSRVLGMKSTTSNICTLGVKKYRITPVHQIRAMESQGVGPFCGRVIALIWCLL